MKKLLFSIFLSIIFLSCETEMTNFRIQNPNPAIIVYGELTNLNGPYNVRISYANAYAPYDVTEFRGQPVSGAEVKIIDGAGNEVTLDETRSGFYQSGVTFKGVVNQNYQLKIRTKDGLDIASDFEDLKPPVPLSEFSYTFINADKVEDMKFEIKASLKDAPETEDFYFIKRQDFVQFLTTCPQPPPPPSPVPVCYSRCWRAPLNTQPILVRDFLINGRNIPVELKSVSYEDFPDWIVQLDVFSVSGKIYNYWQRQEEQRVLGGSIFDKVPAQIIGNLRCTNKADQEVLGVFVVAGLHKERLKIDRFNGVPFEAYQKVTYYVENKQIRYQNLPLWDCRQAGFVEYNIGFSIPEMF